MKRVLLIADYFGAWPAWFPLFIESCRANPTIDWLIHTDAKPPSGAPANVTFKYVTATDYCERVSDQLEIRFKPDFMYNICNIRPAFGDVHAEAVAGYDYFGWCDIDLVFGDLRGFLRDEILEKNVVSTSDAICTGHFTLIKNDPLFAGMYRQIPAWRERMAAPGRCLWADSLDEAWLSRLCSPDPRFRAEALAAGIADDVTAVLRRDNHFQEQWVTPFTPWPWLDGDSLHPEVWYWEPGSLTNWRDGERQFPYLHFMNFKAHRYVDELLYGLSPTWEDLDRLWHPALLGSQVVRIDRGGLHGMTRSGMLTDRARLRTLAGKPVAKGDATDFEVLGRMDDLRKDFPEGARLVDPAGVVPPEARARLWANAVAARRARAAGSQSHQG